MLNSFARLQIVTNRRFFVKGIALISTMITVGIASTVLAGILMDQSLQLSISQRITTQRQIMLYHLSVEALVKQGVKQYKENFTFPGGKWAQSIFTPVDGGAIQAQLFDLQMRPNLNNLQKYNPKTSTNEAQMFVDRYVTQLFERNQMNRSQTFVIVDWMDTDNDVTVLGGYTGAESESYLYKNPPYRTANSALATVDELNLLYKFDMPNSRGVSATSIMATNVFVIPTKKITKVNVNMIPCDDIDTWQALLKSKTVNISAICKNDGKEKADDEYYKNVSEFISQVQSSISDRPDLQDKKMTWKKLLEPSVAVKTTFFLLQGKYRFSGCMTTVRSIMENVNSQVIVLSRQMGPEVCSDGG